MAIAGIIPGVREPITALAGGTQHVGRHWLKGRGRRIERSFADRGVDCRLPEKGEDLPDFQIRQGCAIIIVFRRPHFTVEKNPQSLMRPIAASKSGPVLPRALSPWHSA